MPRSKIAKLTVLVILCSVCVFILDNKGYNIILIPGDEKTNRQREESSNTKQKEDVKKQLTNEDKLYTALKSKNYEEARKLVGQGVYIDSDMYIDYPSFNNGELLKYSVLVNLRQEERVNILLLLLDSGVNPNVNIKGFRGNILCYMLSEEYPTIEILTVLKKALEKGLKIGIRCDDENIVKEILNSKMDSDTPDLIRVIVDNVVDDTEIDARSGFSFLVYQL